MAYMGCTLEFLSIERSDRVIGNKSRSTSGETLGGGPGAKRMGGSLATLGSGTGVSGSTTGTLGGGLLGVVGGAGLAGLVAGTCWMTGASTLGGRCLGVT
eukprot:scaffold66914_cov33-Attheya_sp.AAC.6